MQSRSRVLDYASPLRGSRLVAFAHRHQRRILQASIALALLALALVVPHSSSRRSLDRCILCSASRVSTKTTTLLVFDSQTQAVRPHPSTAGFITLPEHEHCWCFLSEVHTLPNLLGLSPIRSTSCSLGSPTFITLGPELLLVSPTPDGLTPQQRGQGWLDMVRGTDSPESRTILQSLHPSDRQLIERELQDPQVREMLPPGSR